MSSLWLTMCISGATSMGNGSDQGAIPPPRRLVNSMMPVSEAADKMHCLANCVSAVSVFIGRRQKASLI